ncbi:NAD-dependent epimerase/dehydratase family protein [Ruegeria hyattellae]|uniref:NAD-dependent epimerase/dehydratase family protein n=1 Tax=Ruegeria hyattellae TaxID=3233337 RepID=UPI00355B3D92
MVIHDCPQRDQLQPLILAEFGPNPARVQFDEGLKMRCLVVGGTGFLGGAIVDALVGSGHTLSVLSRGETIRKLPNETSTIASDRYGDLSALVV